MLIKNDAIQGDLVTVDTSYLNNGKKARTNYSKATEEDARADIYLQKVTDNLLPAWDRGAKLVITNNWNNDVARTLESLGFYVYKTQRSGALKTGDNNELVALNIDPRTQQVYSSRESLVHKPSGRATGTVDITGNGDARQNRQQPVAGRVGQESGELHRDGGLDSLLLLQAVFETI